MALLGFTAPAQAPIAQLFEIIPGYALFAVSVAAVLSDEPVAVKPEPEMSSTATVITLLGAPLS